MDIYKLSDFRDILREVTKTRQATRPSLTFSLLAKKAGIQRTYLSHVLNGRGSLSPDQLYLLAKELRLDEDELAYAMLLLEIDRCQVPARRKTLLARRDEIRASRQRADRALQQQETQRSDEALAGYYSDALGPIVHMAMHVARFRASPRVLADRLGVPLDRVARTLEMLERAGLVRATPKGYDLVETDIHLAPESPLATLHAALFRMRAIEKRQAAPFGKSAQAGRDLFFTATFAATEAIRMDLKAAFLDVIARHSPRIRDTVADEVFHMNFDLFQV